MNGREVFVSYSSEDCVSAEAICAALEAAGITCWVAPRDVLPGVEWGEAIIDAINAARVMVLIFSEHSNDSPQVRREIERAASKGVTILPIRIADVAPCKSMEYFISAQHWMDALTAPLERHLPRLTEVVATVLGRTPPASTTERPAPAPGIHTLPELPPAAPVTPPKAAVEFPDALLASLEHRLAVHVGPLARVLVRRAAGRAGSQEDLIRLLAAEVPDDQERFTFLSQRI